MIKKKMGEMMILILMQAKCEMILGDSGKWPPSVWIITSVNPRKD